MTFEQIFADWLNDELTEKLSYTVNDGGISTIIAPDIETSGDLLFEPLKNNPEGIACIISVGNSTQTNIPNVHFTTDFFNVRFLCDENKKQELFNALNEIINENNAIYQTFTEDTVSYSVQMSLNKPYIIGSPFDMPIDKKDDDGISESIGVITVQWILSVIFSDNIDFGVETYKLFVDSTEYPINGIAQYSFSENPNSNIWQRIELARGTYESAILTTVYVFVIQALRNDELCQKLENSFNGNLSTSIYGKTLKLGYNGAEILISDYTLTKDYQGGVSVYTLTLIK